MNDVPPAQLTPDKMRQGIQRLNKRLSDVEKLNPQTSSNDEIKILVEAVRDTLGRIFGSNTVEFKRFVSIAPQVVTSSSVATHSEWRKNALMALRETIKFLEEELEFGRDDNLVSVPPEQSAAPPKTSATSNVTNASVFIVHGRDSPAKIEVARLLERAGLDVIILHEQPNAGQTIIEKFEAHGGSAGFAVVLLTPDDAGGAVDGPVRPRARQNVIGEMFWFAGKLGRQRVCALKKGDVEMPSDVAGIGYTDMDDRGSWKAELLKEIEAAGYKVDWRRALA